MLSLLSVGLGAFLIYLGAFTYETEQRKVQNRLEEWWLLIEGFAEKGVAKRTAFMIVVARLTAAAFDQLFGPRLLSLRCITVSTALSVGSMNLAFIVLGDREVLIALWMVVFLSLGMLPLLKGRFSSWQLWATVITAMLYFIMYEHAFTAGNIIFMHMYGFFVPAHFSPEHEGPIFIGGLVMAVLSDLLFIIITRKLLRWSSRQVSFTSILGGVMLNLGLASVFIGIPALLFSEPWPWVSSVNMAIGWALSVLLTVGLGNCLTGLAALVFVVLGAALLIHRLMWPLIARPLYVIASEQVITNRRALIIAGAVLIGVAFPPVQELVRALFGGKH